MLNSSRAPDFILAAYVDVGMLKYLYFVLLLCLYVVTMGANLVLLLVICVNRSLHEPMYLFLCSLFVNEVYGSTGLLPFLLLHILSDTHTVPAALCFLQIFCMNSYTCVELFSLTVMAYDRYLAICCPLQYRARMTRCKITLFIALANFYGHAFIVVMILLSTSLYLCGNVINKVYCDNYSIVKLACSDTTAISIYGLFATSIVVVCPVTMIAYTYARILLVCISGSRKTRQKVITTCGPHLASLLNFSCGAFFEIIQSRFNMSSVPNLLRVFLSLYWFLCQPIFNPLIYGLNMSNIRLICRNLLPLLVGCRVPQRSNLLPEKHSK